jgi:ATP-binding cassette subfamily C protein CydC
MSPTFRLVRVLLPSWRMALLGIFISLFALLSNMALLAVSSWFITSMALAGAARVAMDYSTPGAAVRGLALFRAAGRYAERLANHDTTLRLLSRMRVWFFQRIEPLAPAGLAAHRGGDLLSRIRADVDTLDDFYVRGLVPSVVAVLALCCIVPFLARYDVRLVFVDVAGLALAGILVPLLLKSLARKPGQQRVALSAQLRVSVIEEVQGMAELVALGAIDEHAHGVLARGEALETRQRRLASLQGIGEAGLVAASSLAVWAAAILAAPRVIGGTLAGPEMAMLLVFMLATFEAIMPLPAIVQRAGEMSAAAGRLFELIDARPLVSEPSITARAARPTGALGLRVRELSFRYGTDQPWVIDSLSFEAPAGRITGIVGPTGIGKSSLVNALLRFWEYERGRIEILGSDGAACELRDLVTDEARRLFSVLPQTPYLFHASLRENLLLAVPEDHPSEETALRAALDTAQMTGFLESLPDGLDASLGETGRAVSVGEARRIAVARMLLREAPIYVMDEPTEGLDERTADALLSSVETRLRGKTMIIISHRERDLEAAHHIVRLGQAGHA